MLIEYGPPELDLNLRFRAHALMERLQAAVDAGRLEGYSRSDAWHPFLASPF